MKWVGIGWHGLAVPLEYTEYGTDTNPVRGSHFDVGVLEIMFRYPWPGTAERFGYTYFVLR
jgi:hypothetical protein